MINSVIGVFHFLILGFILFTIGLFGIIISKNMIKILFSIIIMLNAVCINFSAISRYCDGTKLEGSAVSIFIIVLSLIYIIIFAAIIINYNKQNGTNDIER